MRPGNSPVRLPVANYCGQQNHTAGEFYDARRTEHESTAADRVRLHGRGRRTPSAPAPGFPATIPVCRVPTPFSRTHRRSRREFYGELSGQRSLTPSTVNCKHDCSNVSYVTVYRVNRRSTGHVDWRRDDFGLVYQTYFCYAPPCLLKVSRTSGFRPSVAILGRRGATAFDPG